MRLCVSPRWTRCLQALMLGVTRGSVQLRAKAQGRERLVAPTKSSEHLHAPWEDS